VILVDTGPLVALVYRNDAHHRRCVEATRTFHDSLGTVWPVVTEAMHLLDFSFESREGVWQLLESEEIDVLDLGVADIGRMRSLMRKYRDLPMDFADAALVRVGEREGVGTVFTLDRRDFSVYRPAHTARFTLVP
jgi:predicted nucleic acid-binding protein